jgi:hypothetical protein
MTTRLYFPGFPVPVIPGILAFWHLPFPGISGRESREIKDGYFYFIKSSREIKFQFLLSRGNELPGNGKAY